MRRAPRLALIAAAVAGAVLIGPASAQAGTTGSINVTTPADEFDNVTPPGTGCSLREAIEAANTTGLFGGCSAGGDTNLDTIVLTPGVTYLRTRTGAEGASPNNQEGDLDVVTEPVVITGNGAVIAGNDALTGGRVIEFSNPSTSNLNAVTIRDGVSATTGGGIRVASGSTLTLFQSAVVSNHAETNGGGVEAVGQFNLNNSTVSGNTADNDGGGVLSNHGTGGTSLVFATVAFNTADLDGVSGGNGGGVYALAGTAVFNNVIVAGNVDTGGETPDCSKSGAGTLSSGGYNLIGNTTNCTMTLQGTDRTGDPGLDPTLALNGGLTPNHALLPGSQAIDNGVPPTTMLGCSMLFEDQRGVSRPQGPGCDIGAFERVPSAAATPPAAGATPQPTPAVPPKKCKKGQKLKKGKCVKKRKKKK